MGLAAVLTIAVVPRSMRECWPWGDTCGKSKQDGMVPPTSALNAVQRQSATLVKLAAALPADAPSPFQQLSLPLVELILSQLPTEDLIISARAVCREWRDAAEMSALLHVRSEWQLCDLNGRPRNLRSLLSFNAESFVIQRPIANGDSMSAVAIAANITVDQLKRFNNLMTEASLHTRDSIFVPATPIFGRTGEFHFCSVLNRQLVILERQQRSADVQTPTPPLDPVAVQGAEEAAFGKLALLLSKGLRVNLSTAIFYLRSAGGDIRAAMELHRQDNYWDRLRRR